jgi:hypothetical protein
MYNAELQMLREFFWFHGPNTLCVFCNKPLCERPPNMSFGHRRHPKVRVRITLHHNDEDRTNNADINLSDAHSACHRAFHKTLLLKGGLYDQESEEERQEEEEG